MRITVTVQLDDREPANVEAVAASITDAEYRAAAIRAHAADYRVPLLLHRERVELR